MNVSFNPTNPYIPYQSSGLQKAGAGSRSGLSFQYVSGKNTGASLTGYYKGEEVLEDSRKSKTTQVRELLREIQQDTAKKAYQAVSDNKKNGFPDLNGTKESEEEEMLPDNENYNYKEVANKIQRAKTSVSAGQAVLAAKRKVLEIRRKMSSGDCDPEEMQSQLTHAKRMEMVAQRKKHHLELEEMVARTQKSDERAEKLEETQQDIKSAYASAAEEKINKAEDEIFEERSKTMEDMVKEAEESRRELTKEDIAEMNELVSDLGERELEKLEEAMEAFEEMEVVDPHMTKEEFEELKKKHRNSENKAIVKAEMDYLKDTLKHQQMKIAGSSVSSAAGVFGASVSGMSVSGFAGGVSSGFDISVGTDFSGAAGGRTPAFNITV
jgi:hypothetical protein